MKCFIAAVMMASLAISSASVLPWWPSASWPAAAAAWPGAWPAPWAHQVQVAGSPLVVAGAPGPVVATHVATAPAVVAAAPSVVLAAAPSASYTAANRGAVHNAPLPGHAVSQTSLNLQPAPGTL